MPFGYTLNFDIVTEAASCGFLVLACHLATPWTLTYIWLHFVTDAASRGFLVLACIWLHLELWHCDRGCIAWFPRVSMPFGYTFYFDLYLATPCDRRCNAWFPSVSAIRSTDPENPTVEPNMKWIGWPVAEIWPFEIVPNVRSVVGRSSVSRRSVAGRSSIYTSSYTVLIYSSSLR